jgi:hypothetical protein
VRGGKMMKWPCPSCHCNILVPAVRRRQAEMWAKSAKEVGHNLLTIIRIT